MTKWYSYLDLPQARGPKKHMKRITAPKSWMLDKMGGVYVNLSFKSRPPDHPRAHISSESVSHSRPSSVTSLSMHSLDRRPRSSSTRRRTRFSSTERSEEIPSIQLDLWMSSLFQRPRISSEFFTMLREDSPSSSSQRTRIPR